MLRLLERSLPVSILLIVCLPMAWFLVISVRCLSKRKTIRDSHQVYLNKFLLVFSGHLGEKKWLKRCEMNISEACSEDLAAGKPMMLLFMHRGSYNLLPYWLRAVGIRASAIVKTKAHKRKFHRLWRDKGDLFPEQKVVWHRDELKGFISTLRSSGALLMAVDANLGKLELITLKDGRKMKIASGPLRLAEKHNCVVYPCGLESRGDWKFSLCIGDRYSGDKSKLIDDLFSCYDPIKLAK